MPGKGSWAAECTAIALVLGLATLSVFSTYDVDQGSQPSDEQLTTDFFSHEAAFDELVQMLTADHPRPAAKGGTSIDLTTVARLATNAACFRMYRGLLQQISVQDLRYFPDSGKLVLVPDGEETLERSSKSYLYLPHVQPRSLAQDHGYTWRRPGMHILTGDRPLKDSWFIHDDMTMEVAVAPY